MSREIVMCHTIMDCINLGHTEVSQNFFRLVRVYKADVQMSADVLNRRVEADRELLEADMGVNAPKNSYFRKAAQRYESSGRLNSIPAEFRATAAVALYLKENGHPVELLTTNRQFGEAWRKMGGKVAQDVNYNQGLTGTPDYNRARRLLGLGARNVSSNGRVLPTAPTRSNNGPRTRGAARTTTDQGSTTAKKSPQGYETPSGYTGPVNNKGKVQDVTVNGKGQIPNQSDNSRVTKGTTARTGEPIKAPNEDRLHAKYHRHNPRFGLVKDAFQGLNRVIQIINNHIQTEKVEEAWKKKAPFVRKKLEENPELGALVLAFYSKEEKSGAQHDSPMEHVELFQALEVYYGYTREDAKEKYRTGPANLRPAGKGQNYPVDWLWIAPQVEPDVSKLATPFPAFGLAKFVDGLEELVRVSFSRGKGFDEKMSSVEEVIGRASRARFLYLEVPSEISYLDNGTRRVKSIDVAYERPEILPKQRLEWTNIVPVVKLDSDYNPYDAVAAMVFPADSFTMSLFESTKPTINAASLHLSGSHLFKYVRWVKPHKMEVIRDFRDWGAPKQSETEYLYNRRPSPKK